MTTVAKSSESKKRFTNARRKKLRVLEKRSRKFSRKTKKERQKEKQNQKEK